MKNNGIWKVAAVGLLSLALGGGVGTYTGAVAAKDVRTDLMAEIAFVKAEFHADQERDIATQLRIIESLARLEAQVQFIREDMHR